MRDLFDEERADIVLGPGAMLLGGFACFEGASLVATLRDLASRSSFRCMVTPGGRQMSVAMTNCGTLGWITDGTGYRYDALDPITGVAWPPMPRQFADLAMSAAEAAGYPRFMPDACLINRYEPGSRLSLHQDRNERDFDAPIVSVSLGLPATFLWGGMARTDRPRRIRLVHGDTVVWGGSSRLAFHGIAPLVAGDHPETGAVRYNLTFRQAG